MVKHDAEHVQLLRHGLQALALEPADPAVEKLLRYVDLLGKWNRSYNLTAIRDPGEMITRHLLDSLSVMPYIEGPRLVDVGTGPGLPGIPLAILSPEYSWVLLDSNAKKTRFVTQAVAELGLGNVRVITGRVAGVELEPCCNTVISRAFAHTRVFIDSVGHLCCEDGRMLAMKGAPEQAELTDLPPGYRAELISLQVPGLDARRCIIRITRNNSRLD